MNEQEYKIIVKKIPPLQRPPANEQVQRNCIKAKNAKEPGNYLTLSLGNF